MWIPLINILNHVLQAFGSIFWRPAFAALNEEIASPDLKTSTPLKKQNLGYRLFNSNKY